MKKYYSLAIKPGNTGTYFYNTLFKKYNINAEYCALGSDESGFIQLINYYKNIANGISISMPFKTKIMEVLKSTISFDDYAVKYNSCNTIVFDKNIGYNTDIYGVIELTKLLPYQVSILGFGSIGKMFYSYLNKNHHVTLYSRSLNNWDLRHSDTQSIINCTPYGTISSDSPIDYIPKNTQIIIDLAIKKNKLQAQAQGVQYINGLEFYKHQFVKQFFLYTNIVINNIEFDEIAKSYV